MGIFQTAIELLKAGCFVASIVIWETHIILFLLPQGIEDFECLNGMANIFSSLAYQRAYPVRREFLQKFLNQFMPILDC